MRFLDRSRVGWIIGGLFGALVLAGSAMATRFDTPPEITDRRIALTWQPDADDPVYNGNTVLRVDARIDTVYATGQVVRLVVSNHASTEVFAYAESDDRVRRLRVGDGAWLGDLILPEGAVLLSLSIHGSDALVFGALDDGRLIRWDLAGDGQPVTVVQGVPSKAILFPSSIRDLGDLRYVSADVDDSLRVWSGPGQILGRGYTLGVPGGIGRGLTLSNDRSYLGIGTRTGEVRIYDVRTAPNTPMLRLLGHVAAIVDLTFARDASKLASIDVSGQIRVWQFPAGGPAVVTVETGAVSTEAAPARISLSPPRGRLLTLIRPDGVVEVMNGQTGQTYASARVTSEGTAMTSVGFAPDGIRTYVGDDGGGLTVVRAGDCQVGQDVPRCFGGYMVWRSPTPDPKDAVLLRVYSYADSTWTFVDEGRGFVDPDSVPRRLNPPFSGEDDPEEVSDLRVFGPHNGLPHFYSITRFDLVYEAGGTFPVFAEGADAIFRGFYRDEPSGPPTPVVAEAVARTDEPVLGRVIVVPNPYEAGKVPWELAGTPHVEFRNLPERATIRIYTLAGELVREVEHGPGRYGESRDAAEWDLKNSTGRGVASGVYLYQVKTAPANGQAG